MSPTERTPSGRARRASATGTDEPGRATQNPAPTVEAMAVSDRPSQLLSRVWEVGARIRDPNPFDDPDDRRKWIAAGKVSNGPCSRVVVAAHLDGPRRSHSLFEGIDYHV